MFHEKDMSYALAYLIGIFDEVDNSTYERQGNENELLLSDYTMHDLCHALYQRVQTPYAYQAHITGAESSSYYGCELFDSRAIKLTAALQEYHDDGWIRYEHSYELWLAEDMDFYVVDAFKINIRISGGELHTEYRGIKWETETSDDLPFNPMDFHDSLYAICADFADSPTYTL